jgi:tetratricopeptide (TPR) repeat protein
LLASITVAANPSVAPRTQLADEVPLRAIAQAYLDAYSKKDLPAMIALWSLRSKDVAQRFKTMAEAFTPGDSSFSNVMVSRIKVLGNRATLEIAADLSLRAASGETHVEKFSRNFALVKEGGTWKIWWDVPASQEVADFLKKGSDWKTSASLPLEEQFATALLESTPDDQRALLLENSEMVTVELRKALIKMAEAFQSRRSTAKAIDGYRLAQKVSEGLGDKQGVALSHLGMADISRAAASLSPALDLYQRALVLFQEIGDKAHAAVVWSSIGKTYAQQRDQTKALESYSKAQAIFEELKDRAQVADMMEEIGSTYYVQKKYADAIDLFTKCLAINEALGRKAESAVILRDIGNAKYYLENYEAAIEYYLRAVAVFEIVKDAPAIGETMNYLGGASYLLADYDKAIEYYQKALVFEEGFADRRGAARSLFGLGSSYCALGDFAGGLDYSYRNLALLESFHDKTSMPDTLRLIGFAHLRHRNYDAAAVAYRRCLELYEEGGDKLNAGLVLIEIGNILYAQGSFDPAMERYRTALGYFASIAKTEGIAASYGAIASVYYAQRDYDSALDFYQKSLPLYESLSAPEQIALTLQSIAGVHYARRDYASSLEFADRSAIAAREAKSQQVLWQARFTAGSAHRALDHTDEARKALEESIFTIEAMRTELIEDEQAPAFFKEKNAPYVAMAQLLLAQNDTRGAFSVAESLKSHSLWDILRGARLRITRSMTASELKQERALTKTLASLTRQRERDKQLSNPIISLPREMLRGKRQPAIEARLQITEMRLKKAHEEYESFKKRLYAAHPQLRTLRGEAPAMKVEEAGRLLDAHAALLSFMVSEGETVLFVLTQGRSASTSGVNLRAYVLNATRNDLAGRVKNFRSLIKQRSDEVHQSARDLYDLLLAPARDQLIGRDLLVIAPDSILWDLPFQALEPAENRYLVEDCAVVYAPSVTSFRDMNRRLAPTPAPVRIPTLLAFGNPQLTQETRGRVSLLSKELKFEAQPGAENELRSVSALYGPQQARVHTGAEATEERIKAEAGRFGILQISTPAVLSDATPMRSSLLMSQSQSGSSEDGLLQPWEIFGLNLRAGVVVMSECEPASNGPASGDAITGVSWAWFASGCPTVLLNQWKPDDDDAGFLLELHRNLRRRPPAQGLRESALKVLRGEHRHPFYWSRFIVVGR